MSDTKLAKKWETDINKSLKGKTIKTVRYMSEAETKDAMWDNRPVVIFFTDNSYIIPMSDDEGNNGGAMSSSDKKLPVIPVL